MKSIAEQLTTADVNAALRARYAQPEWAIMFEVAASTGSAGRYADAVAMNMYPSRGLALHGFEVKVSRGDWQRELKKPEKAEAISRYCDFWWLVTLPDIVKDGELPLGWGHLELHGQILRVKVRAKERDTVPLDRNFMAAMLRRAHQADEATVTALVQAGLAERTASLRRTYEGDLARARSDQQVFDQFMQEITDKTGLCLRDFLNTDRAASMLRLAHKLNLSGEYGVLNSALRDLRHARKGVGDAEQALEAALTTLNTTLENQP